MSLTGNMTLRTGPNFATHWLTGYMILNKITLRGKDLIIACGLTMCPALGYGLRIKVWSLNPHPITTRKCDLQFKDEKLGLGDLFVLLKFT